MNIPIDDEHHNLTFHMNKLTILENNLGKWIMEDSTEIPEEEGF